MPVLGDTNGSDGTNASATDNLVVIQTVLLCEALGHQPGFVSSDDTMFTFDFEHPPRGDALAALRGHAPQLAKRRACGENRDPTQ
eukprot:scaffold105972_cov16-Prasinocladus_malaysianus.AAC.1